MRQALRAVHSVGVPRPGRATRIEQAPHSPSAQPSLHPVRPHVRSQSRAVVSGSTPVRGMTSPFTVMAGASMTTPVLLAVLLLSGGRHLHHAALCPALCHVSNGGDRRLFIRRLRLARAFEPAGSG